ncbi:hypothetical protein AB4Y90_01400 [Chryseobacterium sp. 2TAF14]|uniref:hypothetical protein n=1 Tax=Chryseobacterium sp. 2TAF14 TaxID=3233007 RepID=UPI003F8E6401
MPLIFKFFLGNITFRVFSEEVFNIIEVIFVVDFCVFDITPANGVAISLKIMSEL